MEIIIKINDIIFIIGSLEQMWSALKYAFIAPTKEICKSNEKTNSQIDNIVEQ